MKKSIILLILIGLVITSCKKSEKVNTVEKQTVKIPFEGTWTRSFKMGENVEADVTYVISSDSIRYEMNGPMQMKYTIKKDTFLVKENKWIGSKDGTPYVIFVKNNTNEAITLLKMKLKTKAEGVSMAFPSDSARSKFSSWNTYNRK